MGKTGADQVRVKVSRKGGALKMKRIQLEVKIVMKGTERREKAQLIRKEDIQRMEGKKRKEDVLKMKRRIQSMRRRGKNKPWKVRKGYMRPGIRRRRKRKSVGIRIRKTKRKSRERKKRRKIQRKTSLKQRTFLSQRLELLEVTTLRRCWWKLWQRKLEPN